MTECLEELPKVQRQQLQEISRSRVLVIVAPRKGLPDRGDVRPVHEADWLLEEHMAEAVGVAMTLVCIEMVLRG